MVESKDSYSSYETRKCTGVKRSKVEARPTSRHRYRQEYQPSKKKPVSITVARRPSGLVQRFDSPSGGMNH